jgi:hypothetical protein
MPMLEHVRRLDGTLADAPWRLHMFPVTSADEGPPLDISIVVAKLRVAT